MSERLKRLRFIKKHSPKRFEAALTSGELVPSAYEMNALYNPSKSEVARVVNKTIKPKWGR